MTASYLLLIELVAQNTVTMCAQLRHLIAAPLEHTGAKTSWKCASPLVSSTVMVHQMQRGNQESRIV